MKDKFFSKLDWAAFGSATLITFVVYFCTLGPSVGLEDSGELATAGAHLGVPHPPGYPFWTLCSWIFCKLFSWVTYMGHPTPAWAISLWSAVAGALAAGCTAMLICRSARDFIEPAPDGLEKDDELSRLASGLRPSSALAFGGGVAGALAFALSPVEWSQSTIVEIYSLNALFLMWVFLLSYRWMRRPSDKILWITAFVFGLGLTNYQVLLFAIVPLAIIILVKNLSMFRDVFIYLIPVALTYQLLQIGSLDRASAAMSNNVICKHAGILSVKACPSTTMLTIGFVLLIGSLVAASVLRARNRLEKAQDWVLYGGGAGALILLLAGTVFTHAETWGAAGVEFTAATAPLIEPWRYAVIGALIAGSVVLAVRASFRENDEASLFEESTVRFVIGSIALAAFAVLLAILSPVADAAGYTGEAYPWTKSTLVFLSIIVALFAMAWFTKKGLLFAIPVVGLHLAGFILLKHGALNGLTHPMSWWFWWPIVWNFILLAMTWLILPNGRSVAGAAFFAQLGVSFYVYMPIVSDLRNPPMNWGYPRTWEGFKHAIMRGQYEAIVFPTFNSIKDFLSFEADQMLHYLRDLLVVFTDFLVPIALVPFAVGHYFVAKRERKVFWQWMAAAFACFLMMSLFLITLAQVKGDIQDGFIQKVKFISSHAMIALWIGYGLVFVGLALVKRLGPAARMLSVVFAALAILVAGGMPIIQNYTDRQMVFELGGNEQNGHTFGWQFGAYQLDGWKAIREQLVADEEPLPDPNWPEPMEPFSIFFGGTDPGRFVPTYMIYSADFRPDVYLITQNALADDTYMSVERDLYGDEIWIPSRDDSAEAFNIYVEEVQSGKRPANGDLRIENGRVQVTGALGVMEINGILTKMMFDHDRLRHSFYVEESYVIPWMYDYLSPHGLIMKINAEKTSYDRATAAKDADFWDWYTRRLLKDPMYRRDFAGQKSFSKLRAAIAGLYARQGRRVESAQAYREACLLYPASPEATFRYAQEILLPSARYDVVLDMLDYTDLIDPNNSRTTTLRNWIMRMRGSAETISLLESRRRTAKLSTSEKVSLAHAYADVNRPREAALLVKDMIDTTSDCEELAFIATVVMQANFDDEAEKVLSKFCRLAPNADPFAWANLARYQHRAGRGKDALSSIYQAFKLNQKLMIEQVQKDKELYTIASPLFQKRRK